MSTEKIRKVVEDTDGVRTVFTTPTPYAPDSLRVFVNTLLYEPDDDERGWTEIDNTSFQFDNAPDTGDIVQVFYTELRSTGSFQDPSGILP